MRQHARILNTAATEAVEEPDTINRRPEVIDILRSLARDPALDETVERVAPGVLHDPSSEIAQLAEDLSPYRDRPLDDAPELIERLALVAWLLNRALRAEGEPTSETPAVALV